MTRVDGCRMDPDARIVEGAGRTSHYLIVGSLAALLATLFVLAVQSLPLTGPPRPTASLRRVPGLSSPDKHQPCPSLCRLSRSTRRRCARDRRTWID